jgi:hypothetical protein
MNRFPLLLVALLAITSATARAAEVPLVSAGAVWKYLDNGSNQGTAWRDPAFNDSAWLSGPAELGYGDGDEETTVSFGANPLQKPITTYFRHQFTVANPAALTSLKVRLVRDDGAVVYINGSEVWRSNMSSGTISSTSRATGNVSGSGESTWFETSVSPSVLVAGTNTVAVEVHQDIPSSSDLSFNFALIGDDGTSIPNLRRGPYLQLGTPTTVIVRWRTDIPSNGRVRYGTSPGSLTSFADDATVATNHSVTLTDLTPFTRYYYSVGTSDATIGTPDSSYTFLTAPDIGTAVPTRIWVLGDSGTGDSSARAVRNAYYNFAGTDDTNLWLMLGDNAYDNGTDDEHQLAVFDMYPELLRSTVLWPTLGNHDTANSTIYSPTIPYYDIFTLPTNGEAGGVPSGTERYYSFDYGNIHFICLDSMTTDRSPTGAMMTWLRDDVASTTQKWIIAFWHHPPYSKGSHDSDTELQLIEMRQNALPILEEAGVDLVLAGHSHSYERSYLIDGHYGPSSTFVSSMKRNGGGGRPDIDGVYEKPGNATHEGAVYAVAGSGSIISGGPLDHPAMFISLNNLGSMVLDIDGDELEASFLRSDGTIGDRFTMRKETPAPPVLSATAVSSTRIDLSWTSTATSFRLQRCAGSGCTDFAEITETGESTYSDIGLTASTLYRYRLLGDGSASNIAEATTFPPAPTGLTATAMSSTQIDLSWTSSETSFSVQRCTSLDCTDFAEISQTSVTTFSDTGLTPSTLYRYRIVTGGSASDIAEATTFPPAPTGLTATATSSTQINLSWTSTETSFSVERCTGLDCTDFAEISQTSTTTFSDTSLAPSTLYRYHVVTGGSVSDIAEATTFPPAPTTLIATATSPTQIDLSWTSSETLFSVERCTGLDCTDFAEISQTSTTTFSDTSLAPSTLYRYRVVTGGSASDVAEATTFPPAPTALIATATSPTQIDLSWTSSETSFSVERCAGAACTDFVEISQASTTTFNDSGLSPSTLYRYRVVTGGSVSEIAEATTFPPAPRGFTATATSTTQIDLSWTSSETSFSVERCTGSGCTNFAKIAETSTTSFSDTGLTESTLYRYRVITGRSASGIAETMTFAAPPSGLTATATSATEIELSWTSSETSFTIERCTGSGCTDFAEIGQSTSTSFVNSALSESRFYRYRVIGAGGGTSNIAEATTPQTIPIAPSGLTATAVSTTRIDVTWTDNSNNETAFRIQRCAGSACTDFVQVGMTTATTFSNGGLTESTAYRYRIVAYNSAGSAFSNIADAATPGSVPSAPGELSATPVSPTRIDLSWTDNSQNETGFRIERCSGSGCTSFANIAETTGRTFANTGLTPSTLYRYRVRAFNASGESTPSNIAEVMTPAQPPPPGPIQLDVATGTSSVTVTWSSTTATHTLRLQQWTGSAWVSVQQTSGQSSGVYAVPNPARGTLYAFRAQHLDAGGTVVATSNTDAALLTTFTDDPLAAGTTIKALHVTQLMTAANQYRAAFGLPAISIPNAAPGNPILAADIIALRNGINQARSAAGLAPVSFAAISPKATTIRAADIQQLRNALR